MDTNEYQVGDLTKTLLSDDNVEENDFFANAAKREDVVEEEKSGDEEIESDATHESSDGEVDELSKPKKKPKIGDSPEKLKRTIFVGNFPFQNSIKQMQKEVKNLFKKYGEIESVRIRNLPFAETKLPPKVKAFKKQFVEDADERGLSVSAYVVFKNEEDAQKAIELNTTVYNGKHLCVDIALKRKLTNAEHKRTIFIGNLPHDVQEEELWQLFLKKAKKLHIQRVRVVRDKHTGNCKGIGYITFKDQPEAKEAVKLNEKISLRERKLRIRHSNRNANKEKQEKEKKKEKNWKIVNKLENDPNAGVQHDGPIKAYEKPTKKRKRKWYPVKKKPSKKAKFTKKSKK